MMTEINRQNHFMRCWTAIVRVNLPESSSPKPCDKRPHVLLCVSSRGRGKWWGKTTAWSCWRMSGWWRRLKIQGEILMHPITGTDRQRGPCSSSKPNYNNVHVRKCDFGCKNWCLCLNLDHPLRSGGEFLLRAFPKNENNVGKCRLFHLKHAGCQPCITCNDFSF